MRGAIPQSNLLQSDNPRENGLIASARFPSRPVRRIAVLDAAAFLDKLLDGAGDRQRQAGLVGHLDDDLHVLERPGEGHVLPVLQRVGRARADQQRLAQLDEVHAVGFAQPAGLDQRDAVDPEQEIVQRLAELAGADVAEVRDVGAEGRSRSACRARTPRPCRRTATAWCRCRRPLAAADRRIEQLDAFVRRPLRQHLDVIGRAG